MIVFNRTIFNFYEPILTTTKDGFQTYTKGKCVDVLLPDIPRNYTQLTGEITTILLHHGGMIWLENEVDEYTHGGGQIIRMPKDPVGQQVYEDVKNQVVRYMRRASLEYCFWLIEKGISKDSWLGVMISNLDKLQGAHFYVIPTMKEGKLPIWFTSKMKHLIQRVNSHFEVSIMIGDEPDITQHGNLGLFPKEPKVFMQAQLDAHLKPAVRPLNVPVSKSMKGDKTDVSI